MQYETALSFLTTLLLVVSTRPNENSVDSTAADHNGQSGGKSIFQIPLGTTYVGKFKYQDSEVILLQNQQKLTDFFFTPFPHVEPNLTECNYNELSGHNELILSVSLYTPNLLESVKHFIEQHQNICRTEYCDVSLLPMHSIRLFQTGLRTTVSRSEYTLDDQWYSNTQFRQSIEFIIYTLNMSICENVKKFITSRCRFPNFEVQYLLHGQQTVARKLEITTEHITSASMYNQIQSSANQGSVALTRDDYRNLLTDIKDQITLNLRAEEGYEGLQDPTAIDKILERQFQHKHVQLRSADDQLWDSLYWTSEETRPDKLSKILNEIIQKDSPNSDKFRYDYAKAEEAMKLNLQLHEKQKLASVKSYLTGQSQDSQRTSNINITVGFEVGDSLSVIDSVSAKVNNDGGDYSTNTNTSNSSSDSLTLSKIDSERSKNTADERQYSTTQIMRRIDAEKLVNYLSNHVQLEDETITPKTINVMLVKFGSLKSNTKLFSSSVLIKTRTDAHILPLRCPYESRQSPLVVIRLEDKYDRLSRIVDNLTSLVNVLQEKYTLDSNQTTTQLIQTVHISESRLNQTLVESIDLFKTSMNSLETRLIGKIEQTKVKTNLSINQTVTQLCRNQAARSSSLSRRICATATWNRTGITVAGGNGAGSKLNQLNHPRGVFVTDDDIIYVADNMNYRVMTWLRGISNGRVVAGDNGKGSQNDQLSYVAKVIVDSNETLFICDQGNQRVQRWYKNDPDGETILTDTLCVGLAMDIKGSLYVSEYDKHRILKWPSGEIVAGGNGNGSALNQLNGPVFVFVDEDLSVFVAETNNHRVTKWPVNAKEGIVVAGGHGKRNGNHELDNPASVVVDRLGAVYVTDWNNHRIMRWLKGSKMGTVIIGGQGAGNQSDQLDHPSDLAFDRYGNLYVADRYNHRIQTFAIDKSSCTTMSI